MSPDPQKRALVLGGKTGLLGQALAENLTQAGWHVHPSGREDFDPFDQEALADVVRREDISHVVNTVAYTNVDQAEEEERLAFSLNKQLPLELGRSAKRLGFCLVHYSTDFVFDGRKDTPYTIEDTPSPASVYGASKLAGEQALLGLELDELVIIRSSWLFGPGKSNFVRKILELAENQEGLRVVADQTGSPTYTRDLADNSRILLEKHGRGLFHLSSCGKATWCELATEAVNVAGLYCKVEPITSDDYPQKAKRPEYSVLDLSRFQNLTGITPRSWVQGVRDYIYLDLDYASRDA